MAYCNHPYKTQTNESINEAIATVALQNVCYSNSISLYSRVALDIGIHNLGYVQFFQDLFITLSMSWGNISKYLHRRDEKKERRRKHHQKHDVKVKRSKQQKKTREEVFKERTNTSYGAGVGLTAGITKKRKIADNAEARGKKGLPDATTIQKNHVSEAAPPIHGPLTRIAP
jgi:hypothetical protein